MSTDQNIVARVLEWLRAGYPQGVPQQDYVALLGLLHRRLTDAEVETVTRRLLADSGRDVDDEQVRTAIARLVHERPSTEDVNRVRSHLAAGGWPLGDPSDPEDHGRPASRTAEGLTE